MKCNSPNNKNASITERDISAEALGDSTSIEFEAADNDRSNRNIHADESGYEIYVRYGFGDTHANGEFAKRMS